MSGPQVAHVFVCYSRRMAALPQGNEGKEAYELTDAKMLSCCAKVCNQRIQPHQRAGDCIGGPHVAGADGGVELGGG